MSERLTLKEACDILNENTQKGYYITTENSSIYNKQLNSNNISHTKWEINEWYITESKLKEYAICNIIPYQDSEENIFFEYKEVVNLRKKIDKLKQLFNEECNSNPKIKKNKIIAGLFIVLALLGFSGIIYAILADIQDMHNVFKYLIGNIGIVFLSFTGICICNIMKNGYIKEINKKYTSILQDTKRLKNIKFSYQNKTSTN